ncbi:MAG TPA: butyrate kinase [Longimicrobiales bacterium]
MPHILTINPGSTSTKVGIFRGDVLQAEGALRHSDADLEVYRGRPILDQLRLRVQAITTWLSESGHAGTQWAAVCARGGLLSAVESGTYVIDTAMLDELKQAGRGEHASNLGAFLATFFAAQVGCPAFIVDPVSVDELDEVARISGLAGLERVALSHALNTKAVAKRYAHEIGAEYRQLRLIVAHLGSGISVSAHRDGRMVDVNNSREEGPFSTERAGTLPALALVQQAIEEEWTREEAERRLFREGGIYSYLRTRDLAEILRSTDKYALLIVNAMIHQVCKEIAAMAAVLNGRVAAILLTGGMAHAKPVTTRIIEAVDWIAPVQIYAGEDELRALAEGAQRVLRGEEPAKVYALQVKTPATADLRPTLPLP